MNKIIGFAIVIMLAFSSLVYAGGDQNCGDNGQGSTGTTGQGTITQNQPPAN